MSVYIRNWRKKRKDSAYKFLGGKCSICNSISNLQFDHIDPKTKIDCIANLWTGSKEKFLSEIKKCQLLCKDCHMIKTENERIKVETIHGTISCYTNKKCRCELCKKEMNIYISERRKKIREFMQVVKAS